MSRLTNALRGTGVALITPFKKNEVDFDALKNITNNIIRGKCEYIVVMGTTGESATLTKEEKAEVIDQVRRINKERVLLVLGVGGNNTAEVTHDLQSYDMKGYSAVLSVSPYYNKPSQEGIYQHYVRVAEASPLPVLLYNVPGRTSSNLSAETTLRLANDYKNIIGIKEASGNFDQCNYIIKHRPKDFLVISGDDNLTLAQLAFGMDGVISVVANAWPAKFSAMVRAGLAGDFTKARKLHYELSDIMPLLFTEGNPVGIKAALNLMKMCTTEVRLPLVPATRQLMDSLEKMI